MNIKEFKNIIFEKAAAKGFSDCEIYYQKNKNFKVSIYKSDIDKYQNSYTEGLSFRGLINGKMGYSYSERIDENVVDSLVDNALQNADIINQEEKEFIYEGGKEYPKVITYYDEINKLTSEWKIDTAKKIEKAIINYSDYIRQCQSCIVSDGESEIYIANTKGIELSEKSNFVTAYAVASADKDGQSKVAGDIWIGFNPDNFNPESFGKAIAEKAIGYLGSSSVKSGGYSVIIKNETFAELLAAFVGNFYAENVQKGFSLLKDKLNNKICSEFINIVDEPLLKNGYATTAFDSEGVVSKNKTIIENGILKTYLYNLKSAEKDGVKSTGNGFKASFKSPVSTSVTNFYIKPLNDSYDNLINHMKNGIVITELSGLHSGTDSISGDFSLAADGFLISDGNIIKPVEQITVAGNFYELLNNVIKIADDLKFLSNGIGSPSILVNRLDISGL